MAIVRPEGLCQWKIPNYIIGNRTSDLPTCSAVPQPPALRRAVPYKLHLLYYNVTLLSLFYNTPSDNNFKSKPSSYQFNIDSHSKYKLSDRVIPTSWWHDGCEFYVQFQYSHQRLSPQPERNMKYFYNWTLQKKYRYEFILPYLSVLVVVVVVAEVAAAVIVEAAVVVVVVVEAAVVVIVVEVAAAVAAVVVIVEAAASAVVAEVAAEQQ